VWVFQDNH